MGEISETYNSLFRLRSLIIHEHPILKNLHIDFCQYNGTPLGIHTSVIIGANGIGKSHLLNAISEIFRLLEKCSKGEKTTPLSYYFNIKYTAHWEDYEFSNIGEYNLIGRTKRFNSYYYGKDNQRVSAELMTLPWRVIASSTTINDKFVAKSTDMYRYKGVRSEKSPSTTGTRTMVRKTVDSLLNSLDTNVGFRRQLAELLEHLGLQPKLELTYSLRYKNIFLNADLNRPKIERIFEEQSEIFKRRTTLLWGTSNYEKIKYEQSWQLDEIANFYNNLPNNKALTTKGTLYYDLLDEESNIHEDSKALNILSALDLLTYPSLRIYKNEDFLFEESSSGETSLICQMASIMSDIQPGSLVLIDEPENSAHPNWQINYISWLKKIFEHYYNCHFIIATHSHFMLSDLEPYTSDIIALGRNMDGLRNIAEGMNTYGWSTDDILYEVFRIRNTKNEALERDLERAIQLIEEKGEAQEGEIQALLTRFNNVYRGVRDPLGKFIEELETYAESKSTK